MRCLLVLFVLALAVPNHSEGAEGEIGYWVWHRTKPLTADERAGLERQGVRTLYWHVGEMQNRSGAWKWKAPPLSIRDAAEGFQVVPVVRLTSEFRQPFSPEAVAGLQPQLQAVAGPAGTLQLDYDCPDRLLSEYATALRTLRGIVPHLSITALAHWPRLGGFTALTREVEAIAPMFYDLQADPTGVGPENPPPPLLDPAQFETVLRGWRACPIPWRAGLPTFARLTVFDRTGLSRGQIPNWAWDDFCFHKSLHTLAPTHLGVTLFRADADTRVAATPVAKDEIVASRCTDRAALAQAVGLARAAGAAGIVFFRLPDGSDPGGWSLADVGRLCQTPGDSVPSHRDGLQQPNPRLILRLAADERLELFNDSGLDLPPRLAGEKSDRDHGYALEIDAPAPLFREALAGDFWRVGSHAEPESKKPVAVAVPLATRLTFWFSHLPAGATLQTGLLQLAPGASFAHLRYRVLNCAENDAWKPVTLPSPPTSAP
jgi:hypothetical protein